MAALRLRCFAPAMSAALASSMSAPLARIAAAAADSAASRLCDDDDASDRAAPRARAPIGSIIVAIDVCISARCIISK